jgi:hypothetical protein
LALIFALFSFLGTTRHHRQGSPGLKVDHTLGGIVAKSDSQRTEKGLSPKGKEGGRWWLLGLRQHSFAAYSAGNETDYAATSRIKEQYWRTSRKVECDSLNWRLQGNSNVLATFLTAMLVL